MLFKLIFDELTRFILKSLLSFVNSLLDTSRLRGIGTGGESTSSSLIFVLELLRNESNSSNLWLLGSLLVRGVLMLRGVWLLSFVV